ncbi:hypothetical protein GALMADRAFT_234062 [Galerina marginata CBS 339.88]|uniref:Lipoprotein n=1 Tax=Galerina marginata (strain CBS 339.88) TaxID=685588 RepID=A0A067U1Q6_GALM3|nr:hypothetical protein GALMADRAFT_234062 [Galerina marginata CBS 339.88]
MSRRVIFNLPQPERTSWIVLIMMSGCPNTDYPSGTPDTSNLDSTLTPLRVFVVY